MEFEEKQNLKLWWLYIILGVDATIVLSIVLFDKGGMSLQQLKDNYFGPLWAVILPFIIIFLIQKNKLTLHINQEGISYRYFPFHTKTCLFTLKSLDKAYIRKYDALSEYGGYGTRIRLWFKFRDKAYILNDKNKGLQLEFKNGKKLLFSTNKLEALEMFLINLKIRYNIQAIE
ncbi:hypothetical protein [Pedobacter rhizosphaerae]|uniref:Uncharacterized protein n=1 Tax=Pedobacter rhizosphaerae TaxID=390241 RepID=A0A1H9KSR8_9SPHI|nr:hypothetical protein [Pedobacter rhizosphaerae]SER02221.1 hypothetical protein SAMN04488023_103133 [Pedobacter rhizosphaerae]